MGRLVYVILAGDPADFRVYHPVLAAGGLHEAEMVYLHRDVRLRQVVQPGSPGDHGAAQESDMRFEPFPVVGDVGLRQGAAHFGGEVLQGVALGDAGPPEVAEAADLVQADRERGEADGFQRIHDLVRVAVFADKGEGQVKVLLWRVMALDAFAAESLLYVQETFFQFWIRGDRDKQSHKPSSISRSLKKASVPISEKKPTEPCASLPCLSPSTVNTGSGSSFR